MDHRARKSGSILLTLLGLTLGLPGTGVVAALPAAGPAAFQSKATTARPATTAAKARATAKKTPTVSKKAAPKASTYARKSPVRRKAPVVKQAPFPRFKTDENGKLVPDLRAAAAIIYNPETNEVIWEEHSNDQRSIASITKVMTAVVFLESEPDMTREVVIDAADTYRASWTYLRAKERIKLGDLFHLLLVASDNAAARALARLSPWGSDGFVQRMNEKAAELGLTSTVYTDPSGLDAANVSSAYDMARLIAYVAGDERISSIMRLPSYTYRSSRRQFTIKSTNQFVRTGEVDVLSGKTGFIRKSGYCFATLLKLREVGPQLAVVVLGARSNAARFTETRNLLKWLSATASEVFVKEPQ
ncbi:MAG: D-alanyl-D-alanine carboxypeptidase family protein [Vicinamibacterales bacterium]